MLNEGGQDAQGLQAKGVDVGKQSVRCLHFGGDWIRGCFTACFIPDRDEKKTRMSRGRGSRKQSRTCIGSRVVHGMSWHEEIWSSRSSGMDDGMHLRDSICLPEESVCRRLQTHFELLNRTSHVDPGALASKLLMPEK